MLSAIRLPTFTSTVRKSGVLFARRGLASHVSDISMKAAALPAVLHLKSGESFKGRAFGAPRSIFGETVFSTSITSCEIILLCV